MPPQHPPLTPSPVEAVQIVTLTVYSSGSSTQSGLPALSSGGGATVPIAPIVGGAVGGMVLAVLLVIIWKHWGRSIKRTERKRRKEVQDMLTIRENTRRNATFKPQSQYRPMSAFNRESRRVTFMTSSPTPQPQRTSNDNNNDSAAPLAPAQTEGEKGQNEGAQAPNNGGDIGSMEEIRQLSPNFASSATHLLMRESAPAGAAVVVVGSERKSESGERPPLEKEPEAGQSSTEPSIPPPPRLTTPSPPPILSSTRTSFERAHSPTPSGSTSKQTAAPRPSRSVRMRTPKRLPDPPSAPPYVARDQARPSSPEPRPSVEAPSTLPRTSSMNSGRTYRSTSPTPLLPPVPPVPVLPLAAEPSASASSSSSAPPQSQVSWSRSPLRNSVLPSDSPVILPRPKNAPASVPTADSSPTSTPGHLPSVSGSISQSGESSKPSRFLGSLRRGKGKSLTGSAGLRPISALSEASVYSTND